MMIEKQIGRTLAESAEKEPGNYFWGGRSAHASVDCWVLQRFCVALASSCDSDHLADLIGAG